MGTRTTGVTIDQQAKHIAQVALAPGKPVLHAEKVNPHILGCARYKTQDFGEPAQHRHLLLP